MSSLTKQLLLLLVIVIALLSCTSNKSSSSGEEQIRIDTAATIASDSNLVNAIRGNVAMSQMATMPSSVLLTGMAQHRLVTIYKDLPPPRSSRRIDEYGSYYSTDDDFGDDRIEHYMPGLDVLFGYNLLNVAHYDLKENKLNFLFDHPVLIKTVYYPSYEQDSLHEKPINRKYYLVSAYDTDTNKDTLINRQDLRRLYYFNESGSEKVSLIPDDHGVERSQYDPMNDVMYVYARFDENHDGKTPRDEKTRLKEPLHIFWIDLKVGNVAKRMY